MEDEIKDYFILTQKYLGNYVKSELISDVLIVFAIVLSTLVFSFFIKKILLKVEKKLSRSNILWHKVLIVSIMPPLKFFIWIAGISIAFEVINEDSGNVIGRLVYHLQTIGYSLVVTWFLMRLINRMYDMYVSLQKKRSGMTDVTTIGAVTKLVKIAVFITSFLVILDNLGVEITGLLAFAGVGTATIGFASKDLLANFFGTLVIYLDKPFAVGDWISSPDKNIEGTVEEISWRITKIRTFERRPLYVPNSIFSNIAIQNNTRMYNRRIKKTIGIRYKDIRNVENIAKDIKSMLAGHKEIDQNQVTYVNLINFSDYSVDIEVYTFTITTDWVQYQRIQQEILLLIADIIRDNNAEISLPTTTLNIPESLMIKSS